MLAQLQTDFIIKIKFSEMNQGNSGAEDKSHGAAWTEHGTYSYVRDLDIAWSLVFASLDVEFGCILSFKLLVYAEEMGLCLLNKVLCC